ncbi:putative Hydrolase Pnkd [Manis pentadactyla]|nr:putative Hydrolase Pnkd [Manis pentadactyla]
MDRVKDRLRAGLDVRASSEIEVQDYGEACLMPVVTLKGQGSGDISITERVRFWVLYDGECKMLEQVYETLALRKELGSGSDVTGVQDVGTGLWVRVSSKGNVYAYDTFMERFLFNSDTLALRKELGSGSDVTECKMLEQVYGEAWVTSMFQVKCEILTKGLGLALVTLKLMVSAQGEGQIDLDHHGVALVTSMLTLRMQLKGSCLGEGYSVSGYIERTETLALRKELGSGTDVTGSARCWNRFMGECAIQFQDDSEAIVVSMVILEFQATGPR